MNASYVSQELIAIRSRTRKFTGASGVLHVILLLMAYLLRSAAGGGGGLVEIGWIEQADILPTAPKTTSPPSEASAGWAVSDHKAEERFVRKVEEADVALESQKARETQDRIKERLATLQNAEIGRKLQIAGVTTPSIATRPALAGMPGADGIPGPGGSGKGGLVRSPGNGTGTGTGSGPIELSRSPVSPARPAIAEIQSPEVASASRPQPAKTSETAARRQLAGMTLTGQIADRPLITYGRPVYPEWAKREGVEGSSTIYFVVLPDGSVKERVVVQKTAGFEDFDENAIEALLAWRFEPLRGSNPGEQWGTITFHYRLSEAQ